MLKRLARITAALGLGMALGSCSAEDDIPTSTDVSIDYIINTKDTFSPDIDVNTEIFSDDISSHPKELCPNGNGPHTYLKDEDKDGHYAKGIVACQPPQDGIDYFLKEDVIPSGIIPLLDCYDKPDSLGPIIYPGALELCDGLDNDCDGKIDEDVTPQTQLCETACGKGYQYRDCLPGGTWADTWSACSAGIPAGEICNDYDDDCDGVKDDNLLDTPASCKTNCGPGIPSCVSGAWGCTPIPTPDCCETVGEIEDQQPCSDSARIFALDYSASTTEYSPTIENELSAYADKMKLTGLEIKIGLIAFTDHVVPPTGWPSSYEEFKSWVMGYVHDSSPEGHLDALAAAINLDWPEAAQKYILLCGNGNFADEGSYSVETIQQMAAAKNITIVTVQLLENMMDTPSPDYVLLAGQEHAYQTENKEGLPALLDSLLGEDIKYKGMVCDENHTWVKFDQCPEGKK